MEGIGHLSTGIVEAATCGSKRPGRHIILKVSREGYAGAGHPACCCLTLCSWPNIVSTFADTHVCGNSLRATNHVRSPEAVARVSVFRFDLYARAQTA